jgi:hypothetical protein
MTRINGNKMTAKFLEECAAISDCGRRSVFHCAVTVIFEIQLHRVKFKAIRRILRKTWPSLSIASQLEHVLHLKAGVGGGCFAKEWEREERPLISLDAMGALREIGPSFSERCVPRIAASSDVHFECC